MRLLKVVNDFIGPRFRSHHWSGSSISAWLQEVAEISKPASASPEGWRNWKRTAKSKNVVVYWVTEELLNKAQNILLFPADLVEAIRRYGYNRFIAQTHKLVSDLPPGTFHDLDDRILHCLFNELVRFVECEKAYKQIQSEKNGLKKYGRPWYHTYFPVLRLTRWRNAQAGLDYLAWEASLTNDCYNTSEPADTDGEQYTAQALCAQETVFLYHWWKKRPLRPDPREITGYSALLDDLQGNKACVDWQALTPEQGQKLSALIKTVATIENLYEKEDEQMLIRLIKIRRCLWV